MTPQLSQQELNWLFDDMLDPLIEATMTSNFDGKFNALMGPISCRPDTSNIFLELEAEINELAAQIAEAAFTKGYQHGFSTAKLEMLETLRHDFYLEPN